MIMYIFLFFWTVAISRAVREIEITGELRPRYSAPSAVTVKRFREAPGVGIIFALFLFFVLL